MISQQAVSTPSSARRQASILRSSWQEHVTNFFFPLCNGEREIQAKIKSYTNGNLISHEESKKHKNIALSFPYKNR